MIQIAKFVTTFLLLIAFVGCSSERDIRFELKVNENDAGVTIDKIKVASSKSVMRLSVTKSPPETNESGYYVHSHQTDSLDANFLVVSLFKDGEPFQVEVYPIDRAVIGTIDKSSEWVKPAAAVQGVEEYEWTLIKDPASFKPQTGSETFTEIKYFAISEEDAKIEKEKEQAEKDKKKAEEDKRRAEIRAERERRKKEAEAEAKAAAENAEEAAEPEKEETSTN